MKRILLVCDVNNWAWHYKAHEIANNLKHLYKIDVVYTHVTPYYRDVDLSKYDHIHVFGWYFIGERETPYLARISTSIASIEYEILQPEKAKSTLQKVKVVAVSEYLFNHLKDKYRVFPCYNGVNEVKFYFNPRFNNEITNTNSNNRPFRVGLACKPPSRYDLHGYTIAEKIKSGLKQHTNIEFIMHVANHKTGVSHEQMVEFYHSLDVFIHTGRHHLATPNPVFEASSTGLPIIATTNGCIPLLIKDSVNGYLIDINLTDDEKITQFIDKILYLSKNRESSRLMGIANREEILRNWTWKQRALDWIPVFEST